MEHQDSSDGNDKGLDQGGSPEGDRGGAPKTNSQQMISFIKEDLLGMTKRYFVEPISGVQALSQNHSSAAPMQAAALILVGLALNHLGSFIFLGDLTEKIDLGDHLFISMGAPLVFMLVMTVISFSIKKATKNGGVIKDELTTGSLFVFPILLNMIVGIMGLRAMEKARDMEDLMRSNALLMVALGYVLLMMVNTLKQSLKASGVSDLIAFYLSPAGVCLGFYVSYKVLVALS